MLLIFLLGSVVFLVMLLLVLLKFESMKTAKEIAKMQADALKEREKQD